MSSSEGAVSDGSSGARPPNGGSAVLCGRNEETRLLLRGLLRLHRYRVLQEASTPGELDARPPTTDPVALVLDAESEVAPWDAQLAEALQRRPEFRGVVILPRGAPPSCSDRARAAGARSVVARPFAIRDLIDALDRALGSSDPPPR